MSIHQFERECHESRQKNQKELPQIKEGRFATNPRIAIN